ncbi:MAG: hypothetical protein NW224_28935 [Leptolyngbyaceae cyanobacterium bins.302]|nr:hypothetical protein [Leptolyngbyaceae cyanobacterium bins.302]
MKTVDQLYSCHVPGQVFGIWNIQCRVRIYYPHPEVQTVVITNIMLTSGWFVPCKAESLATLIVEKFDLNPDLVVWVEHYSRGFKKPSCPDFSEITFDWCAGKASNPEWTEISEEMAQLLVGGETLQSIKLPPDPNFEI